MTEEEKKKWNPATNPVEVKPAQPAQQQPTAAPTTTEPDEDAQLRKTADQLIEFGNSPVEVRKPASNPWQEFVNNRYYQSLQETAEQKAAREKREKNQRMIAAITDGLVGLSNMAGAMGGATPVKQTPISTAVGTNAEKAKAIRDANQKQYETARQYALKLQQAQDADLADREAEGAKQRRDALAKGGGILATIAKNRAAREKAKADNDLKKQQLEQNGKYQAAKLKQGDVANAIRASKVAGGGSGKGHKKEDLERAWREWWLYTPEEQETWKKRNFISSSYSGKNDSDMTRKERTVDDDFVIDVMHSHDGWKSTHGKSTTTQARKPTKDLRRSTRSGGTTTKKKSAI